MDSKHRSRLNLRTCLVSFVWTCLFFANSAPATDDEEYASLVEKASASLSDEVLSDDSLVLQDVVNEHSIYRHDKTEKHGSPIFVRKGNDAGKAIVVLREGEDYLPQCNKKKTFVVLKQFGAAKNQYRIFYAYVKSSSTDPPIQTVEWDNWYPRGNTHNKAMGFGFMRCGKSSMVPCKKELQVAADDSADYEDFSSGKPSPGSVIMPSLPYTHPSPRILSNVGSDYWCDLMETSDTDKRFTGAVVGALTQAMVVLTGANIVYKDEDATMKEVNEEIKKAAATAKGRGRSMGAPPSANVTNAAAEKLVNMGRSTVAGGTMLFYASVVKLAALAIHETPPGDVTPAGSDDAKLDEAYKAIGMNILRSLFRGADFDDPEQKGATPNPHLLLNENTVASLVAGRSVGEAIAENAAQGRGIFGWLLGGADVGTSSSNGEQAIRQYKGVQKDGSVTGSKAIDNLNYVIDNAFSGTKKSAGQIFSENLMAGVYVPYGLVEDVGGYKIRASDSETNLELGAKIFAADGLAGGVLGIGRTSDDRSYADDLLDKALNVVGGAAGTIVDVVGDILGPIGLGGLWNGVAGVTAAGLGGVGAALAVGFGAPGFAIYHGIKLGAKALGIGGVIGMLGAESRRSNDDGNQNVNRDSAPQVGATYGQVMGRRRRDVNDIVTKHLDIQGITDVDLFSHLGWKTMDLKQEDMSKTNFTQDVPFVGFGNCLNKGTSVADFDAAKTQKAGAKLYLQTMRTSCLKEQVDSFNDLIMEGYVKFNGEDKTFNIPDGHALLTKPKLSHAETNALSKAFEMSVYSKNYMLSAKKPPPKEVTRTAATMISMILMYLEEASKRSPTHYVKLTRNAAKLAKTAFTKSLQDFFRYKYCRKCDKDQMRNTLNDCVLFSTLIEFALKEQEHPAYNGMTKEEAFTKYYDGAAESATKKMSMYFM